MVHSSMIGGHHSLWHLYDMLYSYSYHTTTYIHTSTRVSVPSMLHENEYSQTYHTFIQALSRAHPFVGTFARFREFTIQYSCLKLKQQTSEMRHRASLLTKKHPFDHICRGGILYKIKIAAEHLMRNSHVRFQESSLLRACRIAWCSFMY